MKIEEIEQRLREGYCLDKRVSIIRDMKFLLSRIKELEEGIEKHRKQNHPLWEGFDKELYKLLEEK